MNTLQYTFVDLEGSTNVRCLTADVFFCFKPWQLGGEPSGCNATRASVGRAFTRSVQKRQNASRF